MTTKLSRSNSTSARVVVAAERSAATPGGRTQSSGAVLSALTARPAGRNLRRWLSAAIVSSLWLSASPTQAKQGGADKPAAYTETIPGSQVGFDMVPIPAGSFRMGSAASESGRAGDEGPQAEVAVGAFWIGKHEVTWDEYDQFRKQAPALSKGAEAPTGTVTGPTPPYADESWGFGKGRQPAIGMTWHAATEYCRWLSAKTGHRYRLPTEAEWEYAARAGTTTPWSSGGEAATLDASAWYTGNANSVPHRVGGKRANAYGLHDMHGNVAEWTLDRYDPQRYAGLKGAAAKNPVALPGAARYPHVVRGGSFEDDAEHLRSAARRASKPAWSRRDPQEPQSIWWHTDASFVGFRVVRAVEETPALKPFKSKVTRASPNQ